MTSYMTEIINEETIVDKNLFDNSRFSKGDLSDEDRSFLSRFRTIKNTLFLQTEFNSND